MKNDELASKSVTVMSYENNNVNKVFFNTYACLCVYKHLVSRKAKIKQINKNLPEDVNNVTRQKIKRNHWKDSYK